MSMFNQIEKLKYTLVDENNNSNDPSMELLVKYFECRDNDMIDKLLQMNEEKEKKIRDETIFSARRDKIPKLDFEIDNYDDWFYAIKSSIRRTTFYQYFEKKDINIEKNYENELFDLMEDSISEETKNQLQFDNINKNPRKLLKEILRAKQSIKSSKIKVLLEYISNHKYHKTDDINRHLEIIFMLFDELSKLKKEFTEKEKLDKILNSLPEDYSNNIKKLLHGSQQLGLSILYIIKYVEVWNKKSTSRVSNYSTLTLVNDHPSYLYSNNDFLNHKFSLETKFITEPEDLDISDNEKENEKKKKKQEIKVSVLPIKNESLNHANVINNNSNKNDVKNENNNNNDDDDGDVDDDNKTLMPENLSNDGEDNNITEIKERDVSDMHTKLENREIKKIQKQSILNRMFSIKNLFLYFIFMLIIEGLVYFKYDTLKKIIPSI